MLASCFGLGWLPVAPGTWGSLPPVIIFAVMCHFGVLPVLITLTMAGLVLAGSVVCVSCAPAAIAATGNSDPREVVADELAGQALSFLAVPFLLRGPFPYCPLWGTALFGFVLFRVFDVAKPYPVRRLEKLPAGWGVLADDLLAGAYATIVLYVGWIAG